MCGSKPALDHVTEYKSVPLDVTCLSSDCPAAKIQMREADQYVDHLGRLQFYCALSNMSVLDFLWPEFRLSGNKQAANVWLVEVVWKKDFPAYFSG